MFHTVAIVGLGLIGASFAKALRKRTDCRLLGLDSDPSSLSKALEEKTIDEVLTPENLNRCDLAVLAVYPEDAVDFVRKFREAFSPGCCVIDFCGVKEAVVFPSRELLSQQQVPFIGCHPMAGREVSGYENADENLFDGKSMIITPEGAPEETVLRLCLFFRRLGFGRLVITTARHHDEVIAFTSQLAHILSNAYVKSPMADESLGYSGGSFHDLTRVAQLNPTMWTELFFENRENLTREIDGLIQNLSQYSEALRTGDRQRMFSLLKEGNDRKERLNEEERNHPDQ